jgi:hypothetical protein
MITTDGPTVLHEAPKIDGLRFSSNEEKTIQRSKLVSGNGKLNHRGSPSDSLGFYLGPIQGLVSSGGRVETSTKVFERATPRFIHRVQNILDVRIRCAVVQYDVLVNPSRYTW